MKVLVVDDYPGAAEITCVLLRLLGHQPLAATTAAQALSLAETFEPDVVVLDLTLPDASGSSVARAHRRRAGKQPFIAALTGGSIEDDRAESLASGVDMYELKPASEENLRRILEAAAARMAS